MDATRLLSHTKIVWLPTNATSLYQPLDQGVIRTWGHYWKQMHVYKMCSSRHFGLANKNGLTDWYSHGEVVEMFHYKVVNCA
jgi:hypothetical protein